MNDAIEFDSLGDAFELMRAVIDNLKESARELERIGTHDKCIRFCGCLDACRYIRRIPNNDVRLEGVASVLISDDHESRMDTHAHRITLAQSRPARSVHAICIGNHTRRLGLAKIVRSLGADESKLINYL